MTNGQPDPVGGEQPSDAVLDELLRAFEADDLATGRDIDLDSPEVEALLSGDVDRPSRPPGATDLGDADAGDESARGEGVELTAADTGESPASPGPPDGVDAAADGDEADPAGDADPDDVGGGSADADAHGEGGEVDDVEATHEDSGDVSHTQEGTASGQKPATVLIADDGLPDTVYIDGDLGDGSGGDDKPHTVFIDDAADDIGEIVGTAEAERVTGIEPKLRERRIAVQRAEGRKRLRWVVAAAAVVVVIIAALAVLGSSWFSIDTVRVDGDTYSRQALEPIVEDLEGEPVLRVDTAAFERRIEQIPWVREARVTTDFPSSARIEVAEREPLATFQGADGRYRVIDIEGQVLDVVAGQPLEYLLVTSENPPNTPPGKTAPLGFANAGQLARYLTPTIRPRVEAIVTAADGTDTRLQLEGGTEVLFGDGRRLADKLVWLETVFRRYEGDLPAKVDVSTEEVTTSSG